MDKFLKIRALLFNTPEEEITEELIRKIEEELNCYFYLSGDTYSTCIIFIDFNKDNRLWAKYKKSDLNEDDVFIDCIKRWFRIESNNKEKKENNLELLGNKSKDWIREAIAELKNRNMAINKDSVKKCVGRSLQKDENHTTKMYVKILKFLDKANGDLEYFLDE